MVDNLYSMDFTMAVNETGICWRGTDDGVATSGRTVEILKVKMGKAVAFSLQFCKKRL